MFRCMVIGGLHEKHSSTGKWPLFLNTTIWHISSGFLSLFSLLTLRCRRARLAPHHHPRDRWLAGDLGTHQCMSEDSKCRPLFPESSMKTSNGTQEDMCMQASWSSETIGLAM